MAVGLALADGSRWRVEAADEHAARALAQLAALARLSAAPVVPASRLVVRGGSAAAGEPVPTFTLSDLECAPGDGSPPRSERQPGELTCRLPPEGVFSDGAAALKILNVPAYYALLRGGVLLHAALVAHEGRGYLLAGRSGAGKSTASRRVPPPWESLCDDMALAVRGADGRWRVHPWPTWGAVMNDVSGSWSVERALPLGGVFYLEQAAHEAARRLGGGEATCLLNESAEEASWLVAEGMDAGRVRALRLRQFDGLVRLAREVPCHALRLSREGAFWETILGASLVAA